MLYKTMFRRSEGFTLIEVLVVIGILGVLATVLVIAINPLGELAKARDAGRISDITQISRALTAYYTIYGKYPDNDPTAQTQAQNPPTNCWGPWNTGSALLPSNHNFLQTLLTSGDLRIVPIEQHPITNRGNAGTCGYRYGNNIVCSGITYALIYAPLENPRPNPSQDQRPACIQGWGWSEGSPNDLGYAVYLTQ